MSFDNAPGEVEFNLTRRNGGSYVRLNFNFNKLYILTFAVLVALAAILYMLTMIDLSSVPIEQLARASEFHSLWSLLIWSVGSLFIIGFIGYNISVTRKRIVEEFSRFIQSLTTEKA